MTDTIVGYHIQGRGDIGWVRKTNWRVGKILDAKQSEIDILRPHTEFIIDRIYVEDSEMRNRVAQDPEGTAEWVHQKILAKNLNNVDYYQVMNEQLQRWDELPLLARYDMRMMELAEDAGYKVAVANFSVGNIDIGKDNPKAWVRYFDVLDRVQRMGHVVNVHQYSAGPGGFWQHQYPTEWYAQRLEQTVIPVLDKEGFNKVHFVVGEFGLSRLLYEGKPGGWQEWLTEDEYFDQITSIMDYNVQFSDRILGYCMYNTFALHPWQTHEMYSMNYRLGEHYSRNLMNIKPLVEPGDNDMDIPLVHTVWKVIPTTLNFRTEPFVGDNKIRALGKDEELIVKAISGVDPDWRQVEDLATSDNGYVHGDYIEYVRDTVINIPTGDLEKRVEHLEAQMELTKDATDVNSIAIIQVGEHMQQLDEPLTARLNSLEARIKALEDDSGSNPNPPIDVVRDLSDGFKSLNLSIVEPNEKPKYKLTIGFTTHNGSFEFDKPGTIYHVNEKNRNRILLSHTNPNVYHGAGADIGVHVGLVDKDGNVIRPLNFDQHVKLWFDGMQDSDGDWKILNRNNGFEHFPYTNKYAPQDGEVGPFKVVLVSPDGTHISEEIHGMGLPNGWHVAVWLLYQEV